MKKYIILIFIGLITCLHVNIGSAQDHEIKLDPNQDKDEIHVMLSETQLGKYRYGRGKWTLFSSMIDMLVDSLTDRGEIGGVADGNGIYTGNGTVPSSTTATLINFLRLQLAGNPYLSIYSTNSNAAYTQYVNSTTGTSFGADGFYCGLNPLEQAVLWNYENSSMRFYTNNTERMTIAAGGDVTLVAYPNTRDDGTASNFLGSDGSGNVKSYPIGDTRPYKIYTALISQEGTSIPTAVVLENTLGFVPTFTREAVGYYRIHAATTEFTIGKTWGVMGGVSSDVIAPGRVNFIEGGNNYWEFTVTDDTGAYADEGLVWCSLELRVYP